MYTYLLKVIKGIRDTKVYPSMSICPFDTAECFENINLKAFSILNNSKQGHT